MLTPRDCGATTCNFCLTYSNLSVSSELADCLCNSGFSGIHGGTCTTNVVGKYKQVQGNTACVCCTINSNSLLGSDETSDCSCIAGYTGANGSSCSFCEAEKYKENTNCKLLRLDLTVRGWTLADAKAYVVLRHDIGPCTSLSTRLGQSVSLLADMQTHGKAVLHTSIIPTAVSQRCDCKPLNMDAKIICPWMLMPMVLSAIVCVVCMALGHGRYADL